MTQTPPSPDGDLSPVLEAIDQALFPRRQTFHAEELAAAAGVDIEVAERLWRAMGFTAVAPGEAAYYEDDLEALHSAVRAMQEGATLEEVVYDTRVMAAALTRVAEVSSEFVLNRIGAAVRSGASAQEVVDLLGPDPRENIERLIVYFFRRQLRAALWRKLAVPDLLGDQADLSVGFVDLVRFTAVTEGIDEDSLGELIDRFEWVVHSGVTDGGGRIVKMIGDEVMFVCQEPDQAVEIASGLVRAFAEDDSVPPARAGLASGAVLARGGDYFGPVVNLASRIVDIARPSTVVAADSVHEALRGRSDLHWRRIPVRRLRGIGRVPLWAVSMTDA